MRKISIVQRRLETGLDLTQAELRALQREARFQTDQEEDSGSTLTAVEEPFSFLPPTRPAATAANENKQQRAASEGESAPPGAEAPLQEGSGESNEVTSSQVTDGIGVTAGTQEETPSDGSYGEPREDSPMSDSENILSTSGDELRAALNEIFGKEDFAAEVESEPVDPEEEESESIAGQQDSDPHGWRSEQEVVVPSREPREELTSGTTHITEDEGTETSKSSHVEPTTSEETLVLFLLQVPASRGLAATFSASEDEESPFAGHLRVCSKAEGSASLSEEASEFDVNLPPQGLVRLSTGRVGNNGHEWALISLDEEARAYATFDLRAGRNLKATAAVFSKAPSRAASVPLRTSLTEDRGLVLANPTDGAVVVRLALFDEQGNQVSSAIPQELDPLPPGKQVTVFAKGVFRDFSGITPFKGRMVAEVVGDGLIWTAGLSQNEGALCFLPVSEMAKSSHPQA